MRYTNRLLIPGVMASVLIFTAIILITSQCDLLYAAQDMSVWQSTSEFFCNYMHRPLGLLQYVALFLTQFFYYPVLGVLMLIAVWTLCTAVSAFALGGQKRAWLLSVLPVFCVLIGITQIGYWIYYLKLPSYWLLPTLLWLWWSIVLLIVFRIRNIYAKVLLLLLCLLLLTPWNGFSLYAFDEPDSFMSATFYVMAFLLAMQLFTRWIPAWCPLILAVPLVIGSTMLNYRNPCFHAELRMQQEAEQGNWQALVNEVNECPRIPTRQMVLLRDIALLHLKELGNNTSYSCDGVRPEMLHGPKIHMAITAGPIIYYSNGYVNDAYRWAIENGVEYGFTPRRLRMLLRCALVNHEWQLARKYVRKLKLTLFQKSFADEMETLIGHPERFSQHPEIVDIAKIKQHSDILTPTNNYPERILLGHPFSPLYSHRLWHFQGQTAVKLY